MTLVIGVLRVSSVTVFEYERGLRFVRGRLTEEVAPGLYRYLGAYTTIRKFDLRTTHSAVNSQEVVSKDGVAVKVSLSASYRIVNLRTAVLNVGDYTTALYTELQQSLRAVVSSAEVEDPFAKRAEMGPQILTLTQPFAERIGLTLESVAIKDLTLPGDLKKIFAQVVRARQEGLAALERARGETAALRNLANAAQMVQRSPQLLQLRLLQVAGQQAGTTLVVGMPSGTTPLPLPETTTETSRLPAEGTNSDQ